jgi:hypothetical protein
MKENNIVIVENEDEIFKIKTLNVKNLFSFLMKP